jgi:type I restriction enzyme, S subunit
VYSREGTYFGIAAQVPSGVKVCLGQRMVLMRPDPRRIHHGFLKYWLNSPQMVGTVHGYRDGTVAERLNLPVIRGLAVAAPSLDEQIAIAHILASLDDRITLLRETNATLDCLAQTLFKSWFVDFDPVHAKMEGRALEGMEDATAALFPDSLQESEWGLVPRGWRKTNVYQLANVIYGAPFASARFKPTPPGIPLLRIRDLKDENPGVFTEEIHPKGYLLKPGDIAVGMDGEFRAYLWGGEPAWLNQRVCVFHPVNGACSAYIRLAIAPLLAAVEASETATTVIHLGKNDIDRFEILAPTPGVLAAFAAATEPLYARIVENKQMASTLSAARDTLLPRLISGQLRVEQAAEALKAA